MTMRDTAISSNKKCVNRSANERTSSWSNFHHEIYARSKGIDEQGRRAVLTVFFESDIPKYGKAAHKYYSLSGSRRGHAGLSIHIRFAYALRKLRDWAYAIFHGPSCLRKKKKGRRFAPRAHARARARVNLFSRKHMYRSVVERFKQSRRRKTFALLWMIVRERVVYVRNVQLVSRLPRNTLRLRVHGANFSFAENFRGQIFSSLIQ